MSQITPTTEFSINEFVWDRVRDGPAVVLLAPGRSPRYTVAEVVGGGNFRLGRIASRAEDQLCRYVRFLLPEDEAVALLRLTLHRDDREVGPLLRALDRVKSQTEKRGIAWSQ